MKIGSLTAAAAAAAAAVVSFSLLAGGADADQHQPLVDYRFSCNVLGLATVRDVAQSPKGSSLLGADGAFDLSSAHCHRGRDGGVTSQTSLRSETSIAPLRERFLATNATALSLELWMTPTVREGLSSPVPILVIGRDHSGEDRGSRDEARGALLDATECRDTELYVGLRSNLLEIRYADNDPDRSCRFLLMDQQDLPNDELVQVVLSMTRWETNVYVNGQLSMPLTINQNLVTNMTTWDPESKLKLFSDRAAGISTQIALHQISFYDQSIEPPELVTWGGQREVGGRQDTLLELEPLRLVALEEPATVVQGTLSPVDFNGGNRSTAEYSVAIEILSLPSSGTILGDDGPISEIGTRVRLHGSTKKTTLMYRPNSDDYFTSPGSTYGGEDLGLSPDVMDFRMVALDRRDDMLIGWSESVTKHITIQHVNQPFTLILPRTAKLAPFPDFTRDGPVATIEGVHLQDPDLNVDLVRVDVWAYNGTITLRDHVELADFEFRSTDPEGSSWHAHGGPEGSQNMTFVAEPDDVSLILSTIRYEGLHWGQEDSVVIRIYDGVGGPCLSKDDQKYESTTNECFHIVANVAIPAVTWASITPSSGHGRNTGGGLNLWVVLLLSLLGLAFIILFAKTGVHQVLRRKYWREGHGNDGLQREAPKETCDGPELDIVDFA